MSGNFEAHIPALAAAKLDSFFRWSRRRDLRRLPDLLAPGEAVVHLGQGGRSPWWYGTSYWLVVLTNRRGGAPWVQRSTGVSVLRKL